MAYKIKVQVRKGAAADRPTLSSGEFGLDTDTGSEAVWIGTPAGNKQLAMITDAGGSDNYTGMMYLSVADPSVDVVNNTLFGTAPTISRQADGVYRLGNMFLDGTDYLINGKYHSAVTALDFYVDGNGTNVYPVMMTRGGEDAPYYLTITVYTSTANLTPVDPATELQIPIYIIEV
jgi:hypothetical protein